GATSRSSRASAAAGAPRAFRSARIFSSRSAHVGNRSPCRFFRSAEKPDPVKKPRRSLSTISNSVSSAALRLRRGAMRCLREVPLHLAVPVDGGPARRGELHGGRLAPRHAGELQQGQVRAPLHVVAVEAPQLPAAGNQAAGQPPVD